MIKLKFFKYGEDQEFNDFIAEHPPRNTKNQTGIILGQHGISVFYEDGDMTVSEQVAQLKENIREAQTQIMIAEPQIRLKKRELADFKEKHAEAHAAWEKELADPQVIKKTEKQHKQILDSLKQKIDEHAAWLLTTTAGQEIAREQIAAYREVIADLEKGDLVI